MHPRTRLIILTMTFPVVAFTLLGGYLGQAVAREGAYRHLRIFEDVVSLITENYVEDADLDAVMDGALRGLTSGLDTDSAYLTPEEAARVERGDPAPPGGIGVETTSRYYTQIVAVRDDSPAARAGLRPGDYVRTIDDQSTRRLSSIESAALLRGEPGSTVRLSLLRGNTSEPYDVALVREEPVGPNVTGRMLSGGVGYLRVAAFPAGTAAEIAREAARLTADGAARLVVDVRNCGGGSFDEGIEAARLFVASGTLLQREETGGGRTPIEAGAGSAAIDTPLVLLTDYGTAHAAELFAAGLTGSGRAEAVGRRTAGRVSVQQLVRLQDGGGLWLSQARYLQASGDPLHRSGVEPAVVVEPPTVELGEPAPAGDPVLERALERIGRRSDPRDSGA